jgi:formate-dependent nitrite reductase membrane component NrfD
VRDQVDRGKVHVDGRDPRRHGAGSITSVGTQMDSYYGRPIVKEPTWTWEIPCYLFTGGIAGGSAVLHGLAKLAGHERLAKRALYVGAVADAVSPLLLISDLGRPERFLNMLRVVKVTSPMNVGSWVLTFSGGASNTAAVLELLGILKPVKVAAEVVSFVFGPPLTTYTGTLLADTAIPVWHEARKELPWLFDASATASAGAATALFLRPEEAGPAQRLAVGGVVGELAWMKVMEKRLGFVGEVYKQGAAHRFGRIAKACTAAGAGLLAWQGTRRRSTLVGGSALVLAGELALRWSIYKAGFQSARDPKYTVLPQRRRRAEREREATAATKPAVP